MKTAAGRSSGSVFITVTLVLSILLIMLGTLLNVSSSDVRISKSYEDGVKAYFIAESGAATAMSYVMANFPPGSSDWPATPIPLGGLSFGYTKAFTNDCQVSYNSADMVYTIISRAVYGRARRKIEVLITLNTDGTIVTIRDWKQKNYD